ncbi:MAG: hypothetical protein JW982_12495, partial [Spirochaetes bacterium]|nr:hypothetical protein [Spirochaetota bacterium]
TLDLIRLLYFIIVVSFYFSRRQLCWHIGSVSNVLLLIINNGMRHFNDKFHQISTVRYQRQIPESGWKNFHIILKKDEYETFLKIRNEVRFSVSNFLWFTFWLCGVELLNKLIQKLRKESYNKVELPENMPEQHKIHYEKCNNILKQDFQNEFKT